MPFLESTLRQAGIQGCGTKSQSGQLVAFLEMFRRFEPVEQSCLDVAVVREDQTILPVEFREDLGHSRIALEGGEQLVHQQIPPESRHEPTDWHFRTCFQHLERAIGKLPRQIGGLFG